MKYLINIATFFLQCIYQCIKLCPVKNKVTMISRQGNEPSIDFQLVEQEIKKKSPLTEVVVLCRTLDGGVKATVFDKIKYGFHMFVQMYHIATSKVVLLDTYCIVVSLLKHRKSLKVVQMWHSMGTMKLFGYTALDSQEGSSRKLAESMHMHANYNYFVSASENYQDHLAKGFGCDESKAFICPLPRYDLLKSSAYKKEMQEKIFGRYPELRNKKRVLYCPTFRKNERLMEDALNGLVEHLPEDYDLIVKLHPLSKFSIERENVWDLKGFSTFDALFVADYVISDYSCVIYEAGVMELPLCYYIFDFDEYTQKRGFAIDYMKEVKGVISKNPAEIMEAIQKDDFHMDEIHTFINKYIQETDHATEKLVDFLMQTGRI